MNIFTRTSILKSALLLLTLMLSKISFATGLTDVNPDDESLKFMRYIFGDVVSIITGGDGWVGQRAMAGYMVILSLFLRPTLMIFGFFASMLVMIVMGKVVVILFVPFMSSMNADHISGIVTFAAMLGILVSIFVQLAHRAYGLIHELPDKVLRFIGGGAENLGESNHENQSRQAFVGGVSKSLDTHRMNSGRNKQDNKKKPKDKGEGGDGGGGTPDPKANKENKLLNPKQS